MAAKVVRLFSTEGKGAGSQYLLCSAALVAVVEVHNIKGVQAVEGGTLEEAWGWCKRFLWGWRWIV